MRKKLIDAKSGEKVRIVNVQGGRGLKAHLSDMGLFPREQIEVLENSNSGGPLMVLVKGSKIALGYGMAEKILVGDTDIKSLRKKVTVALAGNPNSGKTTIFNNLTGARQHVGNYPGVTVEKKEGRCKSGDYDIGVVDLPGTYSLTAYSLEEVIARNYVVEEKPDVVVDIVDTSNIERNLYLATQFIELGVPLIIALNMMDMANNRGYKIDISLLSHLLGVPVIPMVGHKNQGTKELLEEIVKVAEGGFDYRRVKIGYGKEVEEELNKIEEFLKDEERLKDKYHLRWMAIKLLENDKEVIEKVQKIASNYPQIEESLIKSTEHLKGIFRDDPEAVIADKRYGFIEGACREAIKKIPLKRWDASDSIDKVVTNRFLGIPIFLLVMWLAFQFVANIGGGLLLKPVDNLFSWLGQRATEWLASVNASPQIVSLVSDGIISGVGSVAVFIPLIFSLFLIISILEDSGYMARVAFIMDKLMHKIGLHGKSFLPLLLGFGCNVPAIMGTRILENKRDRVLTILIIPLMSCSARLPIYVLFAGAFFASNQGVVIFSLYILGILLAILMGLLFKKTLFKGPSAPFVMELPPYRVPTLKSVLIHMWERGFIFIKKVGGIIFAASILVWFLSSFPSGAEFASENTYIGKIGTSLAPLFEPLGFGTWKVAISFIFGLVAKEVIVATLGVLYAGGAAAEQVTLQGNLQEVFTPLTAYAFMVFALIYTSCVATIATIKRETGSWRWTGFAVGYQLILAWVMAFIVYQGGKILGWG